MGKNIKSVITCDLDGKVETFSEGAERLFGCKIIRQVNPEGRVTFILCTDNGQKLDFDEKGNVFLGAAKVGQDEDGGNITIRPYGDLTLKLGGKLNLEIENMLIEEKPVSI